MSMIRSINPATEELIASYDPMTPQQIDEILAKSRAAFERWRGTSMDERAALVRRAGQSSGPGSGAGPGPDAGQGSGSGAGQGLGGGCAADPDTPGDDRS